MNVIGRNSGGYNLAARQQVLRAWYPAERVRPVRVELYWRYAAEVAAAARYLGTFAPGQAVNFPLGLAPGSTVILSVVTISPNGIRSVRELADGHEVELAVPVLGVRDRLPLEERLDQAASKHAGRPTVATGVRYPAELMKAAL